jgi:poly(3-hydroxybutyrate) depolymerase
MVPINSLLFAFIAVAILAACSSGGSGPSSPPLDIVTIDLTADEAAFVDQSGRVDDYRQTRIACEARGWTKAVVEVTIGQSRYLRKMLYSEPASATWRGAVIVMHGGGSNYANWCSAGSTARGMMTDALLANEFAVFLLDSTDLTTDQNGALCGKVWDDNVLIRNNHDVPYISSVIADEIADRRPAGSPPNIFLMGFSSGGFMATRAATELGHLVTGFIPMGTASPYGWHRDCSFFSGRDLVAGVGRDNDSSWGISNINACGPTELDPMAAYPNEKTWLDGGSTVKPHYLKIQHFNDSIVDFSCHTRHVYQLGQNGYAGSLFEVRPTSGTRASIHHNFLAEFITPVIDYLLAST